MPEKTEAYHRHKTMKYYWKIVKAFRDQGANLERIDFADFKRSVEDMIGGGSADAASSIIGGSSAASTVASAAETSIVVGGGAAQDCSAAGEWMSGGSSDGGSPRRSARIAKKSAESESESASEPKSGSRSGSKPKSASKRSGSKPKSASRSGSKRSGSKRSGSKPKSASRSASKRSASKRSASKPRSASKSGSQQPGSRSASKSDDEPSEESPQVKQSSASETSASKKASASNKTSASKKASAKRSASPTRRSTRISGEDSAVVSGARKSPSKVSQVVASAKSALSASAAAVEAAAGKLTGILGNQSNLNDLALGGVMFFGVVMAMVFWYTQASDKDLENFMESRTSELSKGRGSRQQSGGADVATFCQMLDALLKSMGKEAGLKISESDCDKLDEQLKMLRSNPDPQAVVLAVMTNPGLAKNLHAVSLQIKELPMDFTTFAQQLKTQMEQGNAVKILNKTVRELKSAQPGSQFAEVNLFVVKAVELTGLSEEGAKVQVRGIQDMVQKSTERAQMFNTLLVLYSNGAKIKDGDIGAVMNVIQAMGVDRFGDLMRPGKSSGKSSGRSSGAAAAAPKQQVNDDYATAEQVVVEENEEDF